MTRSYFLHWWVSPNEVSWKDHNKIKISPLLLKKWPGQYFNNIFLNQWLSQQEIIHINKTINISPFVYFYSQNSKMANSVKKLTRSIFSTFSFENQKLWANCVWNLICGKQAQQPYIKNSLIYLAKSARARIQKRKFVCLSTRAHTEAKICSNEFALAKSAHNFLSTGESLPKFQQISELPTMALFDKIKHQICPEFMDNDTVTKAYTIHGNYFIEKGSTGKFHCQKSDLVTFLTWNHCIVSIVKFLTWSSFLHEFQSYWLIQFLLYPCISIVLYVKFLTWSIFLHGNGHTWLFFTPSYVKKLTWSDF